MSPLPLIPRTCLKIRLLWHNGHFNSHFSISCPCWRNWTLTSRLLWDNLMCIAAWLLLYLCFIAFFLCIFFPWTNSYLVINFKKLQFECFHLHVYLNLNPIHHFQLFPRHTIKKKKNLQLQSIKISPTKTNCRWLNAEFTSTAFSIPFSSVQNLFSTLEIWTISFYTHLM